MAEQTPVEVVIRARNEAQAALNQAIGQLKQLETATKNASQGGLRLSALRDAANGLAPATAGATARIEQLVAAGAGFGPMGTAITVVTGAIIGLGTAAFFSSKKLADTVEQLDNLSKVTGASTGDLQVLQELFERAGIGADTARIALFNLDRAIGEDSKALKALGVTSREPIEALFQFAEAMQTSRDAGEAAIVTQKVFGKGGKDVLAVLVDLRQKFAVLNAEMDNTGQKMGTDLVAKGEILDKEFEKLGGRTQGFGNRIKDFFATATLGLINFGPGFLLAFTKEGQAAIAARNLTEETNALAASQKNARDRVHDAAEAMNEGTKAVTAHAKAVQELVDLFGLERREAEKIIDAQDRLEKARRKAVLNKELFAPKEIKGIEVEAERTKVVVPELSGTAKVLKEWNVFLREMVSRAGVLETGLQGAFSGLTSGFETVAARLLDRTQTLQGAMGTVFNSIASQALSALARIASSKLFLFVLQLLGGKGIGSLGIGGAGGVNVGVELPDINPSVITLGNTPSAPAGLASSGTVDRRTFIIQAIDAHDLVSSAMSANGSMRRAQDRMATVGSY